MNLAGLEDKNICQINTTIIAGALVFLTISAVITSHMEIVKLGGLALGLGIVVLHVCIFRNKRGCDSPMKKRL